MSREETQQRIRDVVLAWWTTRGNPAPEPGTVAWTRMFYAWGDRKLIEERERQDKELQELIPGVVVLRARW